MARVKFVLPCLESSDPHSHTWTQEQWEKARERYTQESALAHARLRREWSATAIEAENRRGREDLSPPLDAFKDLSAWRMILDAQRGRILAEGRDPSAQGVIENFLHWAGEHGMKKLSPIGMKMFLERNYIVRKPEVQALGEWISDLGATEGWARDEISSLLQVLEPPAKVPKGKLRLLLRKKVQGIDERLRRTK